MNRLVLGVMGWVAVLGGTAVAHGVWLAERAGGLTIVYGVGPQDEAYRPDKVRSVAAFDAKGAPVAATMRPQAKNMLVDAPKEAVLFATAMDNGFWTKGPDGKFVNASKSAVSGAQSSSHSIKLGIHIRASTGGPPKPTGATLEIVPLVDVHGLAPGADLPVQVLYEGKPLPNVALFPDYVNDANARSMKTDADGKAKLFVRNNGLNVIGVSHAKPTPESRDADRISYFATLSFVIAFKEE